MKNALAPLAASAVLIALIEFTVRALSIPSYILPYPSAVVSYIASHIDLLAYHSWETAIVALLGLGAGLVAALIASFVISWFPIVRSIVFPILLGLQSVPLIALAPYASIWFGTGVLSKAFLAFLVVYFPAVVIIVGALGTAHREVDHLLSSVSATRLDRLFYVYLPGSLPSIASAMKVTASLAVIGALVAELSGSDRGLGYLMIQATYRFQADALFAALSVASLMSIGLFACASRIVTVLERQFGFLRNS